MAGIGVAEGLMLRKEFYVSRSHNSVVDRCDRTPGRDCDVLRFGKEKKTPQAASELSVTRIRAFMEFDFASRQFRSRQN
jgi:hypothetical protein